jgi:apolipoprotein N-acyltransferase
VIGPPRRTIAPIVLGAAALAASYPPFNLPVLSFVAVAPAVLLIRQAVREEDVGGAFGVGFWYGLASQALVLNWMMVALWHFTPLAALGYLATITLEALWSGALFWFVVRVRLRVPAVPLAVTFPVAWTAVEWALGHQGDIRFPWLGIGTSLADAPLLVQWADIAGARGVTLWLAWCNVMIVDGLLPTVGTRRAVVRRLAPVALTLIAALGYGLWRERTLPTRTVAVVGLVQPNEGYWEKWQPSHEDSVVTKLIALTRRLERQAPLDLVLWPEAAIPGYFYNHPQWDRAIARAARDSRLPVLTGGLDVKFFDNQQYAYYNAAFFYDSTGMRDTGAVYHKHYLVPVVERVPFIPPRWIRLKWFGGFGRGESLPVYGSPGARFGVLICYESAFEDLPRSYRRLGADFLVNITNDAWFGRTSAPYQHESMLRMRAIEARMGVARAANSGISEFVDPFGRAHHATRLGTEAILADSVRTSDVTTVYARWGDWVGLISVLTTLGLAGFLVRRRGS